MATASSNITEMHNVNILTFLFFHYSYTFFIVVSSIFLYTYEVIDVTKSFMVITLLTLRTLNFSLRFPSKERSLTIIYYKLSKDECEEI